MKRTSDALSYYDWGLSQKGATAFGVIAVGFSVGALGP